VDPELLRRKMAIDYRKHSKSFPASLVNDFREHYVKKVVEANPMLSIR
jgi:hypothetical protein